MKPNKEREISNTQSISRGISFQGQGARTNRVIEARNLSPEPYGSNPFRFSHSSGVVNLEHDWKMVENPKHPGGYFERVMLDGKGSNAKVLHGN